MSCFISYLWSRFIRFFEPIYRLILTLKLFRLELIFANIYWKWVAFVKQFSLNSMRVRRDVSQSREVNVKPVFAHLKAYRLITFVRLSQWSNDKHSFQILIKNRWIVKSFLWLNMILLVLNANHLNVFPSLICRYIKMYHRVDRKLWSMYEWVTNSIEEPNRWRTKHFKAQTSNDADSLHSSNFFRTGADPEVLQYASRRCGRNVQLYDVLT